MKYISVAQWPPGTLHFSNDISTDKHNTQEQAEVVCKMLEEDGFGGEGKIFPVQTWVQVWSSQSVANPEDALSVIGR